MLKRLFEFKMQRNPKIKFLISSIRLFHPLRNCLVGALFHWKYFCLKQLCISAVFLKENNTDVCRNGNLKFFSCDFEYCTNNFFTRHLNKNFQIKILKFCFFLLATKILARLSSLWNRVSDFFNSDSVSLLDKFH